jgi:phosphoribosyl-AMP cyclohydrolase
MDTPMTPETILFAERASVEMIEHGQALAPRFDANGLIPVITVDSPSGGILMLGYMNEAALRLTIATGEMHYWSRSRSALWRKGEHSGFIHRLVELRVDDDQDCLLARVALDGPGSCHVGYRSCFYRAIDVRGIASQKPVPLIQLEAAPAFDADSIYAGLPNPTRL